MRTPCPTRPHLPNDPRWIAAVVGALFCLICMGFPRTALAWQAQIGGDVTYAWPGGMRWTTDVVLEQGPWQIAAGNQPAGWGVSPYGQLLLSSTAQPYPNVTAAYRSTRWPSFRYQQLVGWIDAAPDRYLLAHGLEADLGRLRVFAGESAVSSGRFALYPDNLVPGWPYYITQHTLLKRKQLSNDEANVNFGLSAEWRLGAQPEPGGARAGEPSLAAGPVRSRESGAALYAEALIDDYPWNAHDRVVPRTAWLAGWRNGGNGLEYVRVNNFVYGHKGGSSYIHGGAPLGHPLGPDAERWRLRLEGPRWRSTASFVELVAESRGEGALGEDWVGRYSYPEAMERHFLSGVLERRHVVRFGLVWVSGAWERALEAGIGEIEQAGHNPGERKELRELSARVTWRL